MSPRAFITKVGICAPGINESESIEPFIENGKSIISDISLFEVKDKNYAGVGQIKDINFKNEYPRTHELALASLEQIIKDRDCKPDAIIIGVTTGGMLSTEELIKENDLDPDKLQYHGAGTVAEFIAKKINSRCKIITVSTACSSGSVILKLAMEMVRKGEAKKIIVGGVDSLSRLTFFGFNSLQLISSSGVKPLDAHRDGMTVAEASAMMLVEAFDNPPENYYSEIVGGGITCDAYHPAAPDPSGDGAKRAMELALEDAELNSSDIDYINLHGTATVDNDKSECTAIKELFNDLPPLSSIKGYTGHSLAAAGALEAVISSVAIKNSFIPPNVGFTKVDPDINVQPVTTFTRSELSCVLSNSFGFGGNNASVVLTKNGNRNVNTSGKNDYCYRVIDNECVTGAGFLTETVESLRDKKNIHGILSNDDLTRELPARKIRRLKRLPKICIALIDKILKRNDSCKVDSIYFGTGWGPQSETWDFLDSLYESDGEFVSPTDFIGSVHNSPAGQMAMFGQSKGANITTTGGDYSFEQALYSSKLLSSNESEILVSGADEYHEYFSDALDKSVNKSVHKVDGGAVILLKPQKEKSGITVDLLSYNYNCGKDIFNDAGATIDIQLDSVSSDYQVILAGISESDRELCEYQLKSFLDITSFKGVVIDYRKYIGQFATASAVAASLAIEMLKEHTPFFPEMESLYENCNLQRILLLNFGNTVTATEIINNELLRLY